MGIKKVSVAAAVLYIAIFSLGAEARTWQTPSHNTDKNFNSAHVFGEYLPVNNYEDPDFQEGAQMASPLYNPLYASYDVVIVINKSNKASGGQIVEKAQRMRVYAREEALAKINRRSLSNVDYHKGSGLLFYWKVSTARPGKNTPSGHFRPQGFSSEHESSIYDNAPMPFSVFFNGNVASHGVKKTYYSKLGQRASAGCVRVETQRAKDLFHLIGSVGRGIVDVLQKDGKSTGRKVTGYKSLYIVRE